MNPTKIKGKDGVVCDCYGELLEDSNFILVFEDEELDGVWADGNIETDEPFTSWLEVVSVISEAMGATPEQIETC